MGSACAKIYLYFALNYYCNKHLILGMNQKTLTISKLFKKHKLNMEYYAEHTGMNPNTFRNKIAQLERYNFFEAEIRKIKNHLRKVATDMLNTANSWYGW
jgi:predicted transcriptional regulator